MIELLLYINTVRSFPLLINKELTKIAEVRASELCVSKFSHKGWNKPSSFSYRGENLAKDFDTTKEAHIALLSSETHYKNIMNTNFTHIGIASKCGVIVEEFGGK